MTHWDEDELEWANEPMTRGQKWGCGITLLVVAAIVILACYSDLLLRYD